MAARAIWAAIPSQRFLGALPLQRAGVAAVARVVSAAQAANARAAGIGRELVVLAAIWVTENRRSGADLVVPAAVAGAAAAARLVSQIRSPGRREPVGSPVTPAVALPPRRQGAQLAAQASQPALAALGAS